MKTYMVVHRTSELSWEVVEENWRKLARFESATWLRTYFNVDEGVRYCVWQAPDTATLKRTFSELEITFESITEVEKTKPDMCCKICEEHLEVEATADTVGVINQKEVIQWN